MAGGGGDGVMLDGEVELRWGYTEALREPGGGFGRWKRGGKRDLAVHGISLAVEGGLFLRGYLWGGILEDTGDRGLLSGEEG